MSSDLLLDLCEQYIDQMRHKGNTKLAQLNVELDTRKSSTVFLSWAMYLADDSFTSSEILRLSKEDQEIGPGPVAQNIFEPDKNFSFSDKLELHTKAIKIIEIAWPQLFDLNTIIKPRFCPPTSDMPFESVSDPKIFTQIYFLMSRDTPTGWAEIIAHELGHQYLFVLYAAFHKKIDAPWKETFHSAIRRTQRPLIGIMHGAVAEAFMIRLATGILDSGELVEYFSEARELLTRQSENFVDDYATIVKHGAHRLHPTLESFLAETSELVGK